MPLHKASRTRIRIIQVGLLAVLAGLLVRLYCVQCVAHAWYVDQAEAQHSAHKTRPAPRGTIRTADGIAVDISIPIPSLFGDPARVDQAGDVARTLAPLLELDPDFIRRRLENKFVARPPSRPRRRRFVWLKRWVSDREFAAVDRLRIPGLGWRREPRRHYPRGAFLSQVIGYAGIDRRGLAGLEFQWNQVLSGEDGHETVETDVRRRPIAGADTPQKPVPGSHLVLTIDSTVQQIAEEELQRTFDRWQPEGAVAIVMEPSSGAVLAMASRPTFDPGTVRRLEREALKRAEKNRALVCAMEPGSVLKPFVAAAVLQEGLAREETTFLCRGTWKCGRGRPVTCLRQHGSIPLDQAVIKSCNIAVARMGAEALGKRRLYHWLHRFGFGLSTGTGFPGESSGILPPPRTWGDFAAPRISFGQGISVTPLQLVTAFSAIANGGVLMKPRLVQAVTASDGRILKLFPPKMRWRVLQAGVADRMRAILARVVSEGTGRQARLAAYPVAGKTGTAQRPYPDRRGYDPDKVVCSFVGLAPADRPRLCVLVMVDAPTVGERHWGGTVAAPAVREIIRRGLAYLEAGSAEPLVAQAGGVR